MAQIRIEGTVQREGARPVSIHYLLEGVEAAPVLLFANSLGTDLDLWDEQLPEFAALLRVLRYDMRGHGRSSEVPGEYRMEELVDDVLTLLDALAIERVHFCGLSLGGMVGQMFAARHPERVASLTLCATACRIGDRASWDERIALVLGEGMTAIVDGIVERWFTERFRREQTQKVEEIKQMLLDTPPLGYAGCCAAIRDADLCEEIHNITARTLCIAGRFDPVTPPERLEDLATRIPQARVEVLDAAHLVNVEARDAFNGILGRFLAECGAL